jgi:hypothetical protein
MEIEALMKSQAQKRYGVKYCICESWDWRTEEDPRLGNLQTGPICEQSLRFHRRASVDMESVSEDDNRFGTCQVGGDRSPTEEGGSKRVTGGLKGMSRVADLVR